MLAKHKKDYAKETTHSISMHRLNITMAKRPPKANQRKALKREDYEKKISLSELKRLKAAGDGEERNSPLPQGDIIVSHQSCHDTVSPHDAPQEVRAGDKNDAVEPERVSVLPAQLEAVAQEGVVVRQALDNTNTFTKRARVSPAQEGVAGAQAVAQEGEATSQAAVEPERVSVLPAQLEAVAQEGAVLRQALENATTFTKRARVSPAQEGVAGAQAVQEGAVTSQAVTPVEATRAQAAAQEGEGPAQDVPREGEAPSQTAAQAPFTKRARAQEGVAGAQAVQEGAATSPEVPAQAVAREGGAPAQAAVREGVAPAQTAAHELATRERAEQAQATKEEGSSPPDRHAFTDQFIKFLLNVDHHTQKFMIIKLVSNINLCRSIEEVLSTVPIISQATFNKSTVNWEECTPPYAVDQRAFRYHTRGKNRGLPRDK